MKTIQRIIAISIAVTILLVPTLQTKVLAAEPTLETDTANAVSIKAVFHFREGDETVNSFKIFDTLSSGFDRTKALTFFVEGVIGWDRPLLYKAIGDFYTYGKNVQYENSEFDVDIIFARANEPYRQLRYSDCQVKAYDVFTEAKPEKAFSGNTASNRFAYVDKITFDCRGFEPSNPVYQKMLQHNVDEKTAEARANLSHVMEIKKSAESMKAEYVVQGKLITKDFSVGKVPSWVEQNVQWLSEGKITSQEYQNLLNYLVSKGVL